MVDKVEILVDDIQRLIRSAKFYAITEKVARYHAEYAQVAELLLSNANKFPENIDGWRSTLEKAEIRVDAMVSTFNYMQDASQTNSNMNNNTSLNSSSQNLDNVKYSAFKLKGIELPKFGGQMKEWRNFWQSFEAAVHTKSMKNIQKFHHLVELCYDDAKVLLEGLAFEEENYEEAILLLKRNFGDPKKLATIYYNELDELDQAHEPKQQRANFNTIKKIFSNLFSLGIEIKGQDNLCDRVCRKFSKSVVIAAYTRLDNAGVDGPKVDDILGALSAVLRIEERVEGIMNLGTSDTRQKKKQPLAAALVGGGYGPSTSAGSGYGSGPGPASGSGIQYNNKSQNRLSQNRLSLNRQKPNPKTCVFCGHLHRSMDCKTKISLKSRQHHLQTNDICFYCLKPGHGMSNCFSKRVPCPICNKDGHAAHMCVSHMLTLTRMGVKSTQNFKGTFLETFICIVNSPSGAIKVRGVVDSCSKYSYMSRDLVHRCGLSIAKPQRLNLCLFGTSDPLSIRSGEVRATLTNVKGSMSRTLDFMVTPCVTGAMETSPSVDTVKEVLPSNYNYADSDLFEDLKNRLPLDIIIGNNHQYDVFTGEIRRLPYNLVLRQSIFGWIPTGELRKDSPDSEFLVAPALLCSSSVSSTLLPARVPPLHGNTNSPNLKDEDNLDALLGNLFSLDALGIKSSESQETDDQVLDKFRQTVRFENNRYVVRWPWKQDNPNIQSNYRMCYARLKNLFTRSSKELLQKYDILLKEQLALGIIEPAPKETPFPVHYLPHHAIIRNDKLRVVNDASAKTSSGHSLNDLLHRGPVLLEDLVGLILNFRLNPVALTSDIEKAFLQVGLNEVDRDVVRFLWVKDINAPLTKENIIVYRFARTPFGVISSPFLLNIVLQELLSTSPVNKWHSLCKNKFYVDNFVMSVPDTSTALNVYNSMNSKLSTASFNLREWTSNDNAFLKAAKLPTLDTFVNKISILGLNWDRQQDTLSIKLQPIENETKLTKRLALKFYASIFDPLGFFGPSTLKLKLFIRDCWRDKFAWDSPLPPDFIARWLQLYHESLEIPKLPVSRLYWHFPEKGVISLHVFCDASKAAFACCAYLVYSNASTCRSASSLIYSKVRAAPVEKKKIKVSSTEEYESIKEMTIPRLELMAVLIGKRASLFLKEQLDINVDKVIIWTDATTVLQWMNSATVLPKFVQNRVSEIRRTPNLILKHVPTDVNPADVATRGMKPTQLASYDLWWKGPPWLCHEELWPLTPETTETYVTPVIAFVAGESLYNGVLTDEKEKEFANWNTAVIFFKNRNIAHSVELNIPVLSDSEEYSKGENSLILELQRKYFPEERKVLEKGLQPNWQLELFLDTNGIIRCKGRLQNVSFPWDTIHPILLPRQSKISELYIMELHVENFHIGCSHLLAKLRERFWVIKGRAKVKSIIHRCIDCRRWDGGPYSLPPLPPLPLLRVAEASPFLHTGVDYLGPAMVLTSRDSEETTSMYVVLFVCLVTRAVHLEVARDQTADEFLMCLQRFAARRGTPKFIISDNAGNFTSIQKILVGDKVEICNYKINNFLSSNFINWKFIPAYAPWQGGAYERLVALVKKSLKRSYGLRYLDYVQFSTVLCQVENVINSRPLTYVSSDEVLTPLTPNNFLRLRTINVTETIEMRLPLNSDALSLTESWRHCLTVIESFWDVFRKHYLLALREQHSAVHHPKKGSVSFVPRIGDLVLIKEPSAPRADWRFGVIQRLDKRQAVAQLSSNGKTLLRSINLLYPLELPKNIKEDDSCSPQNAKKPRTIHVIDSS